MGPEKTFRFARNSAATRYPYPWHPEAKSRAHIECAPLGDDVVPYDGSRRWPVCAFDNVRAAVRVRRLRKRGLYAARYDKTVAWVIVTEFIPPSFSSPSFSFSSIETSDWIAHSSRAVSRIRPRRRRFGRRISFDHLRRRREFARSPFASHPYSRFELPPQFVTEKKK